MTIGVAAGQHVFTATQGFKISSGEKVFLRHLKVFLFSGDLVGIEQVLAERVRLVIRSLLGVFNQTIQGAGRHVRDGAPCNAVEYLECVHHTGESIGIEKAYHVFVIVVGRKIGGGFLARVAESVRPNRCCETVHQSPRFVRGGSIAGGVGESGQSGNILPEAVPRRESIPVIPAAQVFPGRRQSGSNSHFLQQPVLVQAHIRRMNAVELVLQRSTR